MDVLRARNNTPRRRQLKELILVEAWLATVVSIQVELAKLGDKWVAWICTSTLVIKCLLRHLVKSIEEVLFIYAVILDSFLNTDVCLELLNLLDEVLKTSRSSLPVTPQKRPASA